jgi:hypothetical protein
MSQQQRVMDVDTGSWAEKLAHAEAKVQQHVKKHVRQKVFFQRQLDKAQGLSQQLRDELNEAKNKLVAVERGAKKIDRNMEVAQCDMDREHKQLKHSLQQQVVKVATMLANRRELSRDTWDASAIRARAGNQKVARMASGILVRVLIFFVCLHFVLIGSSLAGARAQSCPCGHATEIGKSAQKASKQKN